MKTHYKKNILSTIDVLAVVSLIIPMFVSAKNSTSLATVTPNINAKNKKANTVNATTTADKIICDRLISFSANVEPKITGLKTKLKEKRDEITNKIETGREERDDKLSTKREQWDANRQEQFAKLLEHAATDSQKQAVAKFKNAVEAAILARRQAIDTAIKTFRDGVKKAISERKTATDNAVKTFNDTVATAKTKAQDDCANGVDPKTVRLNYQQALKAARDKFQSDKKDIEKLHGSIEPLITAKKLATEKAIADFETAVEKARTDLKAAFPTE